MTTLGTFRRFTPKENLGKFCDSDAVALDVALCKRGGLSQFAPLVWPEFEPHRLEWNWHHGALCEHLDAVRLGQIQNLLICIPPATSKSGFVSTMWPAHVWTQAPETKFIYSSYAQELSNKNAKQHRDLVQSDFYQKRWGNVAAIDTKSSKLIKFFETTAKGFRYSTSVGGTVTGRHADVLVFDDLLKVQDARNRNATQLANDFWFKTMATRMSDPTSTRKIGIMQRLSTFDTAAMCEETGEYTVLKLPMEYNQRTPCKTMWSGHSFEDPRSEPGELLWPSRFDAKKVAQLKDDLGSQAEGQMNQNPVAEGGGIFKEDYFQDWLPGPDNLPAGIRLDRVTHSWDLAFKGKDTSDPVCGQVWGASGGNFFLLDMVWRRMTFGESKDAIRALWLKWRHITTDLIIEDKANGPAIMDELRKEIPGIVGVEPRGGKEARANAVEAVWRSMNVWLPPESLCPKIGDLKKEHTDFPKAMHDDSVDAGTQAITHMRHFVGSRLAAAYATLTPRDPVAEAKSLDDILEARRERVRQWAERYGLTSDD